MGKVFTKEVIKSQGIKKPRENGGWVCSECGISNKKKRRKSPCKNCGAPRYK